MPHTLHKSLRGTTAVTRAAMSAADDAAAQAVNAAGVGWDNALETVGAAGGNAQQQQPARRGVGIVLVTSAAAFVSCLLAASLAGRRA